MKFLRETTETSPSDEDSSASDDDYDRNRFNVFLDSKSQSDRVLAVKRGADGKAVSKSQRTGNFNTMPVESC